MKANSQRNAPRHTTTKPYQEAAQRHKSKRRNSGPEPVAEFARLNLRETPKNNAQGSDYAPERPPSPRASSLWPSAEGVHVKLGENWTLLRWEDLQAFLLNPVNTMSLPQDDIVRRTADFLREEANKTNGTHANATKPAHKGS
ncbi:hypothetical protein BT69DRAFT_1275844 [Atractiella rhizophila]|nr:hypothetical protein BT69DRAFT_1275844 [Atractiella rhizophila]